MLNLKFINDAGNLNSDEVAILNTQFSPTEFHNTADTSVSLEQSDNAIIWQPLFTIAIGGSTVHTLSKPYVRLVSEGSVYIKNQSSDFYHPSNTPLTPSSQNTAIVLTQEQFNTFLSTALEIPVELLKRQLKQQFNFSDLDVDGLTDFRELELKTNPLEADSDGDGYSDGIEVSLNHNPLDPNDKPNLSIDDIHIDLTDNVLTVKPTYQGKALTTSLGITLETAGISLLASIDKGELIYSSYLGMGLYNFTISVHSVDTPIPLSKSFMVISQSSQSFLFDTFEDFFTKLVQIYQETVNRDIGHLHLYLGYVHAEFSRRLKLKQIATRHDQSKITTTYEITASVILDNFSNSKYELYLVDTQTNQEQLIYSHGA